MENSDLPKIKDAEHEQNLNGKNEMTGEKKMTEEFETTPDGEEETGKKSPSILEDLPGFVPDPKQLIKALLFASPEYLTINRLKDLLEGDWDTKKLKAAVVEINNDFREGNEPYEIVEANNSFRLRTRVEYHYWIKKLFKESSSRRLSQAALEILAIIAYKQPITKAEIEDIRGVNVDGTLKGLLDRKLIAISGKSEKIGNPFEYSTTKDFLHYFGINDIGRDLPKLSEFEQLIQSTALIPQISKEGDVEKQEQSDVDEE